jgi:hypothetical protein
MKRRYRWLVDVMSVAGVGLATIGSAPAQDAATFDISQLPAIQGKVAQYSLTPRGDVNGLILADGTEILLPPPLGPQLVFTVKPGDAVTIHGLRARVIPMMQAMSISNDATGKTVVDDGQGGFTGGPPGGNTRVLTVQGRIKAQLHGPRGDLDGALLEDGTIVRLPPPEAQRLAKDLAPGAPLSVEGFGLSSPLGRVIAAQAIGPEQGQLAQVAAPPRGRGRRPPPSGGPLAPPDPDIPPSPSGPAPAPQPPG